MGEQLVSRAERMNEALSHRLKATEKGRASRWGRSQERAREGAVTTNEF